ncbi:hypothetical protein B6D52_01725 [Candidatus Parcubacteria bacterium 4484_255]|nr:MAG: hypothetical protein B6D52_01725 [Candidatus Parcubacteria bacterium 4484_255]
MKIKKDYILLLFLLVIIVFTIYFLISSSQPSASVVVNDYRPAYLSEPIPPLEELEVIINNPKFQEMKYTQSFFRPVLVEKKGRVNPFMPFVAKEEE